MKNYERLANRCSALEKRIGKDDEVETFTLEDMYNGRHFYSTVSDNVKAPNQTMMTAANFFLESNKQDDKNPGMTLKKYHF